MPDREKVIKDLEECLSASCRGYRPRLSCPYNDDEWDIMRDALALLKEQDEETQNLRRENHNILTQFHEWAKEQEDEKKRVMKVIWDTLHEGLSIDTIPDQDWVYEQIRHRIEDT